MADEKLKIDYDRQIRYFQFDVRTFYKDFADSVEYWLKSATNELENNIIEQFPSNSKAVKLQIGLLRDLFQIEARESLERFKNTAEEIFTLPPNVLLPGYLEESVVPEAELEQLTEEVNKLEQKYVEEAYFNAELTHEAAKFDQTNSVQQMCSNILTKLKRSNSDCGKPIGQLVKSARTCDESYITNSSKNGRLSSNLFKRN